MQAVGRDRTVEQVVRGAGVACARIIVGIGERAYDLVLVLGRHAIGGNFLSGPLAPGIDWQNLGSGGAERASGAGCRSTSKQDAASKKRTAVEQPVAGNIRHTRR